MGFRNPVTTAVDPTARDLANQALTQIIPGSRLAADAIDGKTITGATITGGVLQTAASGAGIKINQQAVPGVAGATRGVISFTDGVAGDVGATLTSTPGTSRSTDGGAVVLGGGSYSSIATPALSLAVDWLTGYNGSGLGGVASLDARDVVALGNTGSTPPVVFINGDALTGPWITYTPTYAATGFSLGNGVAEGRYQKVGKLVTFISRLTIGSTTVLGTGNFSATMPVGHKNNAWFPMATGEIWKSSGGARYLLFGEIAASGMTLRTTSATAALTATVTGASPVALAAGDVLALTGTYEAA